MAKLEAVWARLALIEISQVAAMDDNETDASVHAGRQECLDGRTNRPTRKVGNGGRTIATERTAGKELRFRAVVTFTK